MPVYKGSITLVNVNDGQPGQPGQTYYTWIKYADDDKGSNMSDSPQGKKYIGIAYNKSSSSAGTDPSEYAWSLIKGDKGEDGKDGRDSNSFYFVFNQTEILKFIDGNDNINISPSILTASIYKKDSSVQEGEIQVTELDLSCLSVQVYNLNSGEWYQIADSDAIKLNNHTFEIDLQGIINKKYEQESFAANEIKNSECILKVSYTLTETINQADEIFQINDFLNIRYGMNRDMAALSIKAEGIVASMQDTKISFDANGLSILNGNFEILKSRSGQEADRLLYAENGNLALRGHIYADGGYFKGELQAASGTFTGALEAASGSFKGTLDAASGTFAGDISAATGIIGGFQIEDGRLTSINEGIPNIILDGINGHIEANNITLGTGAVIKEYIKIGEQVELRKVATSNDSFIRVMDNTNEILALKADGTMRIGNGDNTIILSGTDGSIMSQNYNDGLGWKISNTNSIFNDVTVKGSIRASVLEYGETQAIGGALLVRPSTRILAAEKSGNNTVLFLEEVKGFNQEDYCRIDSKVEELKHEYYQIISVDINNKKITVSGNAIDSIGKPIVNFGQNGDNIGITINGSTDDSFCAPQSISVFEFDLDTKLAIPRVILGKLPNENSIYGYAAGTYGLYAENVLLKGSLVTQSKTEESGVMYSGISTVYSGGAVPKSNKLSAKITGHNPSEILLWAGAEDTATAAIEDAKFFVDRNGNMYAGSGYFEGTIITDATITASAIETATIHGSGNKPALKIEDAAKGIYFTAKNEKTGLDDVIFEVNKDSIIANVSNFSFNNSFTIGNNGSLTVPNLYVIGDNTITTVSDEIVPKIIMLDNQKISYVENFNQSERSGLVKGYIDFSTNLTFSPDGINQTMLVSNQEVRIKGNNTSLYIENSVKYGEIIEYKPVQDAEGNLIGYDLYIE